MSAVELTFLGGASEVGASCTLLQVSGHTILVDGGMRPAAREGQSRLPDLSLLEGRPPEVLLITHAHIDHTGALPMIAFSYPHIPIYATESTRVLTEVLLRDSVRIMEQEQLRPDGETPLYNTEQVEALLGRIQPVPFSQRFAPIPAAPQITVQYIAAGHILGAAMLYFETPEGTFLHTGDISVTDQRTIKGLDLQRLPEADLVLSEGTYGNRTHTNRKEEEHKLATAVQEVLQRGGRILCPAFAVGRAQEIVLILKAYRASGQVSPVPIYLDGMVRSVCDVYQNQSHDLHPKLQRFLVNARRPLFADTDLHIFAVRAAERQALIQRSEPAIIISSSGMLTGGASPLYASAIAEHEKDCIMFTGYQDEESPGAALLAAKRGDTIRTGATSLTLNCQVTRYNLSAHADAEQIVATVTKVNPTRLILVHGEPSALKTLADRFKKFEVDIPTVGTTISVKLKQKTYGMATTTASNPVQPHSAAEQDNQPAPPSLHDLWAIASTQGPQRPWTSVELGRGYYGSSYRPAYRSQVEQVLRAPVTHFKVRRIGAQPVYYPRAASDVEQLQPLSRISEGDVVLVQGKNGPPQIGLVLSAPADGTMSLVADQWKQAIRPINLVQLLPHLRREQWLSLTPQECKQQLMAWRKIVDQCWVDLFALWEHAQGAPFTYADLCERSTSEEERLAWGLELLAHGHELFRRSGMSWDPLDASGVLSNPGFAQHLALLRAGAGAAVTVNGQRAVLTGRSNWRLFEIQWTEESSAGTVAQARASNIQLALLP